MYKYVYVGCGIGDSCFRRNDNKRVAGMTEIIAGMTRG